MDKADARTSRGRLPLRTLLSYGSSMIGLNGMLTMMAQRKETSNVDSAEGDDL